MRIAAAFAGLLVSVAASARPGGGQSFRSTSSGSSYSGSSGSSYSGSSGSSYSGSSRSSSGSSLWSSSGSRDSSSSSNSSGWSWGSSTPSDDRRSWTDTESYRSRDEVENERAKLNCIQGCTSQPAEEVSQCLDDCRNLELPERSTGRRPIYRTRPPPTVAPDEPMVVHYWIGGILLGLVAVGGLANQAKKKRDERFWTSVSREVEREAALRVAEGAKKRHTSIQRALTEVRSQDDGFSFVLFEDFLNALYVETQKLRGEKRLDLLAPFVSKRAREAYDSYPADQVSSVIVGGMETKNVVSAAQDGSTTIEVEVAFDVNYTETREGEAQAIYVREVWKLARPADVKSRPPERARVIGCANCGAPLEKMMGQSCEHCGAPAGAGKTDWLVTAIAIDARELRGPMLTGTTEEEGTDLFTLVAPDAKAAYAALCERDPDFSWGEFVKRVELVFHTFHRTWSAQDLGEVRGYLSDNLFSTQCYWIEAYKAQQLRNVTERPEIVSVQMSRLLRDKYYDAMTVRVFAQCLDYTLDTNGRVVGGSRDRIRQYTEYWTFIRSVDKTGAPKTAAVCPSCGAPIDHIQISGECKSCHVVVTSGRYDWTLSRIEQDEVYRL